MTREILAPLSPEEVIDQAKSYFTSPASGYSGSVVEQGDGFVRFDTFRGHLAISATREGDSTRVRCSTLRYHPSIGKFLSSLSTEMPAPEA
ncbi:MAG: hypothetical protein GWN99_03530 [Gemmatimonadetes bacterium]|uniref:Uncharacterized protein n=1 Tax=Candidatus Kutchimonas denitrificans TaxID=3056748 RepID=A0AAE4Z7H0_9BACT|nr:hypothetical protein [Gemmatimonadota bacterium]NIR75200.1 hypothetical protein [Candidatus Kutchimonas denitrificans]NIS00138.1 hypothetical protein [Gemmatimonadota bacterium]NIT65730.1 hypothetical protein [Gemmatimonadota bacterium]NIU53008.1 hypothetical protein [Gemmatimonadota bacterium]